jgi:hypothetical protein
MGWIVFCLPSVKNKVTHQKRSRLSSRWNIRHILACLISSLALIFFAGPTHGAITKVQDVGTANSSASGTTLQVTVPAGGVTAGNSLIVLFAMGDVAGPPSVSCADDASNAYGSADVDFTKTNDARLLIFSAHNVSALTSGQKITLTISASITDRAMSVAEFSGLGPTPAVDQTSTYSAVSKNFTSGSVSTTAADELLIGGFSADGPTSDTFTPDTTNGWAALGRDGTSIRTIDAEWKAVTATGTYSADGTNSKVRKWAGAIVTYATPAILDQAHYRWRENDDTESAAAWKEDEDTKAALGRGEVQRIRFLVENEGGISSGGVAYRLEVAETATCSSGSYSAVPTDTSGDWQMVASQLVEGAATTNFAGSLTDPGGYTWVDGEQRETSNTTGPITLAGNAFSKIEFSIKTTSSVTYGGDYCFRLSDGGAPLDKYSAYAEAEVRCEFEYRRLLTIDKDQVGLDNNPGTLSDYPVLVHLTGNWLKTTIVDSVNGRIEDANGLDILFRYDGGSCTSGRPCDALDFEIEKYDGTNGELIAWVRIPSLSKSADTDFYIYYGNACVTDDSQNATGVWDANYKGVWHLKEDPEAAAPQFLDSTSNPNDGTANTLATANQVAGQIDGSLEFDDSNERHVSVSDHSSLQLSTNIAVSAWVNTSDAETDTGVIVNKWSSGTSARNYWLGKLDQNSIAFFVDDTQSITAGLSLINDGAWHHVTGVADVANSLLRIYVDGVEKTTASYSGTSRTGTNQLHIGHGSGENIQEFEGIIDEVRVSNIARTADWIQTDYYSQYDPTKAAGCTDSGFICMGSEETDPATAVSLISFTARGQGNAAAVEWQTAREFDNLGFHLYRATSPGGTYTRLTDKLISAKVQPGRGGSYSYLDTTVTVGSLYYYKLEDIDIYGTHTLHGPIGVDWDADGLPDDWEITHGLNPWVNDADLDYDGDGLSNFEEYERDLDPFNPDTDGDGILDGAEDGRLEPEADSGSRTLTRGIEVLDEDENGVTLELVTTGFEAEVVAVGGQEFEQLHIADYVHGYTDRLGAPRLPLKGILIEVPEGQVAELSVLKTELEPYYGYRIYPVPEDVLDAQQGMAAVGQQFVQDQVAYNADGFYPQTVAALGQSYVFRDQIKQQVIFYPLDFNPVSGQLNLYKRIRVRIDYVEDSLAKAKVAPAAPWQPPLLASASDALSSEQISALALWMPPLVINPLSPMLSSIGTALAAVWSPPEGFGSAVYKISTDAEGIYRMDRTFFSGRGLDAARIDAIDLEQVRLFNLGREVALYINDQGAAGCGGFYRVLCCCRRRCLRQIQRRKYLLDDAVGRCGFAQTHGNR